MLSFFSSLRIGSCTSFGGSASAIVFTEYAGADQPEEANRSNTPTPRRSLMDASPERGRDGTRGCATRTKGTDCHGSDEGISFRSVRIRAFGPRTEGPCSISSFLAKLEGAQVRATAAGLGPGAAGALAAVGVLHRHRRDRLHVLRQRREERRLVAAHLVVLRVQAARLDLGDARVELGAAVLLAGTDFEIDLAGLDRDDVRRQVAALLLGQANEGGLLLGRGSLVHQQDRLRLAGLLQAERVARGDDGDDAKAVELDVGERAGVDLPGEDGVLAGQVDLGVGEAGAGPHVTGAGLDVLA